MSKNLQATIQMMDRMSPALRGMVDAMNMMISTAYQVKKATGAMVDTSSLEKAKEAVNHLDASLSMMSPAIDENTNSQANFNRELQESEQRSGALVGKIKAIAATWLGMRGIKLFGETSDTLANMNARLAQINDGQQSVAELQEMIYESANRSRGEYMMTADVIGKMGMQARNAFGDNKELIAFTEQLNKTFKIAGTDPEGVRSVMYNLTQAMASGVLRGQDLNAVMSNTPMILENVAEYLETDMSQIRALAEEGAITSEVVKNAMLAAAEETDKMFEQMPLTFAQIGILAGNKLLHGIQPSLQRLNQLLNSEQGRAALEVLYRGVAQLANIIVTVADIAINVLSWVGDNISWIEPLVVGLATAFLVWKGSIMAVAAAKAILNAVMAASPIYWIVMGIGLIVAAIYKWIQSVGGIQIAWLIVQNKVKTVLTNLRIWTQQTSANLAYQWGMFKVKMISIFDAIANGIGSAKARALTTMQDWINSAIDMVNGLINAVNTIPGVSLETIKHVTFGTQAKVEAEAQRQQRARELAKLEGSIISQYNTRQAEIDDMRLQAMADQITRESEIRFRQRKQQEAAETIEPVTGGAPMVEAMSGMQDSLDDIAGSAGGIKNSVDKLDESVDIQNEDISYLRELMTQRAIQNFSWEKLEIKVDNTFGDVHETADLDGWTNGVIEGLHDAIDGLPSEVMSG